jgi:hypothetical protein
MSAVQKNSRPRSSNLIPVPHNTRKPAATPPAFIRLAGNGGVMVVGSGPLSPYLPAGFVAATSNVKGR